MTDYRSIQREKFNLRGASALLVLLAATGCGALLPSGFDARMDRYVGRPEAELIAGLGPPQRSWPLSDGSHVLQFGRDRTEQYGGQLRAPGAADARDATSGLAFGTYDPAGLQGRAASAPTGRIDPTPVCAVDVTVDAKGVVRSWTPRQGDCRAN
jgi:hypothetical protein